jgi:hypothetical protein
MFIEFDQTTMANMTAALESVCMHLPRERDGPGNRKRIADAIVACAKTGRRTLEDLHEAGATALAEITRPPVFDWFGLRR